ncbi:MAG TPA: class I SAM-dependent methyltransferase [Ktedonobacteraceae bacterium]|nr:class I SAM-dependent methyltransferase [Ktedonobacteraceae bacterium]
MIAQTSYEETLASYLQAPAATFLLDLNFGFARARILDTALRLQLFTLIAQGSTTCSVLASLIGCPQQSLQRLLDALIGLNLLEYKQEAYGLRPLSKTYLVEGQPGYLGLHLQAVLEQWDTWSALEQVVRSGKKQLRMDWGSSQGRGQNAGMFAHVFPLVFPVAWQASEQFEQPLYGRVLDMFAGSGAWAIAMALRHSEIEVIARDEPTLLEIAGKNIQQFALAERISLQCATEDTSSWESESFRLIIVSHTCRFLGESKTQELLKECYRLLQPGGQLLLVDVMSETHAEPSIAQIIQLSLFLNTEEGDIFTVTQFHLWLKAAGFQSIKKQRIGHVPLLFAMR